MSTPVPAGDHEALRALLQRYSRAVDARDADVLADLFHPDAELSGSRGTETLEEFLTGMRAPRTFPTSMHVLADPLIDLGPGRDEAVLDTYAVVYQLSDPASERGDLTLGIRYLDDAVRLDGRWVIR
ncbi:MAG TPA: nuclear transport factor 2 family protein, partial [Acidimicrobiales bacterium]